MPFREPALSLRDNLDAIDAIAQFVRGMDFEASREDRKTIAAVERKLLLTSEAATRLGKVRNGFVPACRGPMSAASATGSGIATTGWMLKRCGTPS
ncbi:MAG: HepT-like ribonuclease domain-containing protein [Bryobacteraceae bacterium]